jgi:hypothetical protein
VLGGGREVAAVIESVAVIAVVDALELSLPHAARTNEISTALAANPSMRITTPLHLAGP